MNNIEKLHFSKYVEMELSVLLLVILVCIVAYRNNCPNFNSDI